LGREQRIHEDGWLLSTQVERKAFKNDWPRGRRTARSLGTPRPIDTPTDDLIRAALRPGRGRGLILNARPRDGISWTAQAALDIILDEYPRRQVSVFYDTADAFVPESFNIAGQRAVVRCGRAAKVIPPQRRFAMAARILLAVLLVVSVAILSLIAPIVVEQGTIDHSKLVPAYVIAGLASILALVARILDLRQDTKPSTFDKIVEEVNALLNPDRRDIRAEERIDRFVCELYEAISRRESCRIVLIDELKKLHSLDRRLVNLMLSRPSMESPVKKWVIFDSSREALQMKRRASPNSCIATLKAYELQPLDADQIRAIALQRGIHDFDPAQVIGTLDQDDPMEAHWRAAFRQAEGDTAKRAEPTDLHILWLMCLASLGPEQPRFRSRDWTSAISSKSRTRDVLLHSSLSCSGLNRNFVRSAIDRLANGPWRSAFNIQDEEAVREQIALKPAAARAIAAEAWDMGFGRRGFASAYWALYWDDHAATGHQRRTGQIATHLVDAFHHQSDVAELAAALPAGRLAETVERVLAQCLQFAELRHIAPLMRALFEFPEVDPRSATSIAMDAYVLTQDPDVALAVPDTPARKPIESSSLLVKRLSRLLGVQAPDRLKLAHSLMAAESHVRIAFEVEQLVYDSVVGIVTQLPDSSADDPATVVEMAVQSIDALIEKLDLLTLPLEEGKRSEISQAVLMLKVATASIAATSVLLGLVHSVSTRRHTEQMGSRLVSQVLAVLEDSALAVRTLESFVAGAPFKDQGSWPVVLDGACQHLSLVVAMTCSVLAAQPAFQLFNAKLRYLNDEMDAQLELPKGRKASDYLRPAELTTYLWMFLGLEGLASAAVLQLSALAIYMETDPAQVGEITKFAPMSDVDYAYLDIYRAYSRGDSLDLRATYVARAASRLLRTSASGPLRLDLATRALCVLGGYDSDNVRRLMTELVDEFGVDSVVRTCADSTLRHLVNAVENLLGPERGSTDPSYVTLDAFYLAFRSRLETIEDAELRASLEQMLRTWNLRTVLSSGPIVWEVFSRDYRTEDENEWAWTLNQVLAHGDVTSCQGEAQTAYRSALDSALERARLAAATVFPNELLLAYSLYRRGLEEFRSRSIRLMDLAKWQAARVLPIATAQDIVRALAFEGSDDLYGVQSVLDARQLERDAASRLPILMAAGRYFAIFDGYAAILLRYGLKVAETPEEIQLLASRPCEDLLGELSVTGYIPEGFDPESGVSAHFLRLGRCLESVAHPPPDNLQNAREQMNYLARRQLQPLLQAGHQLESLPQRVRRVLLHHSRIHRGTADPAASASY
jgi:hypothetical protein